MYTQGSIVFIIMQMRTFQINSLSLRPHISEQAMDNTEHEYHVRPLFFCLCELLVTDKAVGILRFD